MAFEKVLGIGSKEEDFVEYGRGIGFPGDDRIASDFEWGRPVGGNPRTIDTAPGQRVATTTPHLRLVTLSSAAITPVDFHKRAS